jgi:flagellar biosynthetic protein FliO
LLAQILLTIVNLILVLGVAYLVMLGLKKYQQGTLRLRLPGMAAAPRPSRHLQVVESISLGPQRSLFIVTVGRRAYLIGATGQQLTVLDAMSADDVGIPEESAAETASPAAFVQTLTRLLTTPSAPAPSSSPAQAETHIEEVDMTAGEAGSPRSTPLFEHLAHRKTEDSR